MKPVSSRMTPYTPQIRTFNIIKTETITITIFSSFNASQKLIYLSCNSDDVMK